jgi:acyl-CoA reductase-like NAD-dependent aldehyde dehydrogenase
MSGLMRFGESEMLQELLLSKPVGFAVGLLYVVNPSLGAAGPGGIPEVFANYVAPIALVIYFLVRDEKRDKLATRNDAAKKEQEDKREHERAKETLRREERMADRIDELETYINETMLTSITENKNCVNQLCNRIETLVEAIRRSDSTLVKGKSGGHGKDVEG